MDYRRLLRHPGGSFFLFGPRGTGKSTWLRLNFPDAYTVDLLRNHDFYKYAKDPELFEKIPLSALLRMFFIHDAVKFANQLCKSKYACISADIYVLRLCLHDKRRGEPSESFLAIWEGIRAGAP